MLTPEMTNAYIAILQEELIPATGCTEPIAIAFAAARLHNVLGALPERVCAEVSGNIIKNVKSVVALSLFQKLTLWIHGQLHQLHLLSI